MTCERIAHCAIWKTLSLPTVEAMLTAARQSARPGDAWEKRRMYRTYLNAALAAGIAAAGVAAHAQEIKPTQQASPIEVPSTTTSGTGGAELMVSSDGIVTRCEPLGRTYWNVPGPPGICSSFPVGSRYSQPTTHNGRPVRRRVRVQIQIEASITSMK